jgi:hypothetical protein
MASMMKASQKVGAETPIRERPRASESTQPSRHTAAAMPSGMPMRSDSRKATVASSSVAGAYWMISSSTGRRVAMETPRSPCARPPRKMP